MPVAMLLFEVCVLAIPLLIIPQRSILSSSFPLSILFFPSLFFFFSCPFFMRLPRYPGVTSAVPSCAWLSLSEVHHGEAPAVTASHSSGRTQQGVGAPVRRAHLCAHSTATSAPAYLPACLPDRLLSSPDKKFAKGGPGHQCRSVRQ